MAPTGHSARNVGDDLVHAPAVDPAVAEGAVVYLRAARPLASPTRPDDLEQRMQAMEERAAELANAVAATSAILVLIEARLNELRDVEARVAALRADLDAGALRVACLPIRPCPLTERELEVLMGLSDGKVYKQIAHDMSLSVSTVRSHLHHAYAKLGVLDRAQAVLLATRCGWI